ncbi:MAG: amidohydrolase family protein, partial [Rhodospirillaceae bacterium]|nr:amidohydrolase family protein [Rhodospirillaceae bacterium]
MIIDCHGHFTTAPDALWDWRDSQMKAYNDTSLPSPDKMQLQVSDDQVRDSLEGAQLKLQSERGTDLTIFSPRASAMGHHEGDAAVSELWTMISNDMIHRAVQLYPDNFVGVGQLPQSPGVDPRNCIPEL